MEVEEKGRQRQERRRVRERRKEEGCRKKILKNPKKPAKQSGYVKESVQRRRKRDIPRLRGFGKYFSEGKKRSQETRWKQKSRREKTWDTDKQKRKDIEKEQGKRRERGKMEGKKRNRRREKKMIVVVVKKKRSLWK